MGGLLDQAGEYERRCDGIAAACFAVPRILVGLHFSRVVAALRHADGRTDAVRDRCLKEIVETLETFEVAQLHQLCGLVGKSNRGHLFLLATGARTIRVPDSEAKADASITRRIELLMPNRPNG